jgi:DNA-binding CsgD family transcriptional regulator
MPEMLRRWVDQQVAALKSADEIPPALEPLVLESGGKHLVARLLCEPAHHILLLEEQRTRASPRSLEALGLTPREAEILARVSEGKTNAEIAAILAVSSHTVRKHLEHIYLKLGVETRTAAVAIALTSAPDR